MTRGLAAPVAAAVVVTLVAAGCAHGEASTATGGASSSPGSSDGRAGYGGSPAGPYQFVGTVLEDPGHGPELCLGVVAQSYPPQCGGIRATEWSWDGVPNAQSANGTTWAEVRVVGTYDADAETFTPTGPATAPSGATGPPSLADDSNFAPLCDAAVSDPERVGQEDFSAASLAAQARADTAAVWVSNGHRAPADQVLNVVVTDAPEAAETQLRGLWGGRLCVVQRDQPSLQELAAVQAALPGALGDLRVWASYPDQERGLVVAQVAVATAEAQAAADQRFGPGVVELESILRRVG